MNKLEVIGLGAGDMNQLPLGIYKKLTQNDKVIYTRTMDHPVIEALVEEGVSFHSFDAFYKAEEDFSQVYQRIVNDLLDKARNSDVIYTVPGHPMLAEMTVQLLLSQNEIDVEIVGGQSYLDALFTSLQIDPIEGFQFVDGTDFERRQLSYRQHLVFCQVYDEFVASQVKLTLLEDLPPEYEITIVEAVGSKDEKIIKIPLEELDRSIKVNNLTSVYVPPASPEQLNHTFYRLVEVIRKLRAPGGCPWDQKQTHESLREYTIEEVYELIDAIDLEDDDNIIEELGDILMHVLLHSQIGDDNGYFSIDEVVQSITDKMIHRHPHVFGNTEVNSVDEVLTTWDELKKEEKGEERKSVLDGIPKHLPSLSKAYKLQHKAAKIGFDWTNPQDIWDKLTEELKEVKEAIREEDIDHMEDEFGDVLFVVTNIMRFYKIHPEVALNRTNQKFFKRFSYVEEVMQKQGKKLEDSTLNEMDAYWEEAKERE